jgi:hypothetical protein
MGKYPCDSSDRINTIMILNSGGKKLKVVFNKSAYDTDIYIGGYYDYCIYANVSSTEAFVLDMKYYIECDLVKPLQRSTSTIMIFNLMLMLIKDKFPYVTRLYFRDTSYSSDSNQLLELSELNYISTGQPSFYQTYFGAQLREEDIDYFREADAKFQEKKTSITWSYMKNETIAVTDDSLQNLYESTSTWHRFFGPIRESMSATDFRNLMAPWLHTFITTFMSIYLTGLVYYVEPSKVSTLTYTIEPWYSLQRYTRRNPRRQRPKCYM